MKIINNTYKILYIYLFNKRSVGLLFFSQQIESEDDIKVFTTENEWINYVNDQIGNDTWFNEEIKAQIKLSENMPCIDIGYLTQYNFRLSVNDQTEQHLEYLSGLDNSTIELASMYGDKYYLNKNEFMKLFEQYKLDKPLYLNLVKS